jgi:hypothetical protein
MVLEDDAAPSPQLQMRMKFWWPQIPEDWELVHFGAIHKKKPEPVTANVSRIRAANACQAQLMKKSALEFLANRLETEDSMLDTAWNDLFARGHSYSFEPPLIPQRKSYSDIVRATRDPFNVTRKLR